MNRYACAIALALGTFTGAGAQAPADTASPTPLISRLAWELRADGLYFDNFFQAPAGATEENVFAGAGQLQVTAPFRPGTNAFLRGGITAYDRFRPGAAVAAGGRLAGGIHALTGIGGIRFRNPRVEIGGEVGSADVAYATATYSIRPVRSIEASLIGDYYQGRYEQATDRDHHFLGGGGALRYRGFGYGFMPGVGAAVGRLDVRLETESYDENAFWVEASSLPRPNLYISARVRHRARDYITTDPASSSFGRRDTRNQLTLAGDIGLGGPWNVVVYYSLEDADSTVPSRVFTSSLLITGLAYRFGG